MDRDQALAILRAHEPELRAAGVEHLRLFGSMARGDQHPESDVDLAADYCDSERLTLFDISHLHLLLTDLLGCKIDLSERTRLRPLIQSNFERDNVLAL